MKPADAAVKAILLTSGVMITVDSGSYSEDATYFQAVGRVVDRSLTQTAGTVTGLLTSIAGWIS